MEMVKGAAKNVSHDDDDMGHPLRGATIAHLVPLSHPWGEGSHVPHFAENRGTKSGGTRPTSRSQEVLGPDGNPGGLAPGATALTATLY